jgi:hypothetical protein
MGNTRKPDDGYKGEYPAPLDWGRIIQELGGATDTGEDEQSSTLTP